MKKGIARTTLIIGLIALIGIATVFAANLDDVMFQLGERTRELDEDKGYVIAVVDGTEILSKDLEILKISSDLAEKEVDEAEALDKLIEKQLVYNAAIESGIDVSDSEVDRIIEQTKQALEQDDDANAQQAEYIAGLGISEEEYWEMVKPIYKKMLIMGKYKNSFIKEQFIKENNITDAKAIEQEYAEYFKEHVESLKSKANIEYKTEKSE
jgi:parvulin-like peptidyl-prolyl isomerase